MTPMLKREEVLKIAKLARLELTDAQVEEYRSKLGRVLDHVAELSAVETSAAELVRHVPPDAVAFREDRAIPSEDISQILENAPDSEENQFSLPSVLDSE